MNTPILYDKNTTNFNTEGLGRLTDSVEDVIVTENTSGFFELEMVYLLDAELSAYIIEGNFIYSHTSERDSDMLKFTIYSVEPDYTEGLLYVNARLTLLDVFMKSVVPEGIYNTTDTRNVLNNLKTHIYPTYNFTVTGTDSLKFYLEHEETTVYDIIYGTNGLVEQTGVTLRFYDNGIQVTSTRGNQQPVEITERDFLDKFKIKESRENMVTRIIPYTTLMKDTTIKDDDRWTKDTTETKVYGTPVLSPNIANGYPVITRYVEYRNEITGTRDVTVDGDTIELNVYKYEEIGTLNTEALSFFTDNPNIDEYEITTTIESLGLYENQYGRLESLALYDKADIYIAKHQKLVQTSVAEVVHNVTIGRNTALRFETAKVTIGKVESVLNSGKVSQKELSDIVASQNQNIRITNSIINAQGNRVNFVTTLPPVSKSKEGDVTFLEKDDKVELWEFKDGAWVIDIVVSNDQYIKDKVDEAMNEAEQAKQDAIDKSNKALTDAKAYAVAQDTALKTSIQSDIDSVGDEASAAKQAAQDAYANAVAEAEAKVQAKDEEYGLIFGDYDSTIESIEADTQTAKTKAEQALEDVDSIVQVIGSDGGKIAQMVMTDSLFSTTVRDSVEVGGRNLFLNSDREISTTRRIFLNTYDIVDHLVGQQVTVSFDTKLGSGGISRPIQIYRYQDSGVSPEIREGYFTPTTQWVRHSFTGIVLNSAVPSGYTLGSISFYDWAGSNNYILRRVKIEKGNVATDWSPAPVDKANQSQVTQLSNSWALTLKSGNDIKTQINATTDGIRLQSKLIHLSGTSLIDDATIKSAHIDNLNASKITGSSADFNTVRAGVLTADAISATHINGDSALFDKLFSTTLATSRLVAQGAWITDANIISLNASKINAGTIATARLDASDIVTKGLTADVVTSTHIKADTALIDNIFGTTALIEKLTSKTAFINSIKAIDISASKITTGTLNAANVTITNLDVNTLTGNKSSFITSLFNGTNSTVRITSVGMDALRNDGSIAARFINDGIQIWGGGSWRGSLSYAINGMVLWAKNNGQLDIGYQGTNTSPNNYSTAISIDGDSGNITANRPLNLGSSLDVASTTTLAGNIYLNGNVLSKINAKSDFDITGNARFRGDIHVTTGGSGIRFRQLTLSGNEGVAILNVSEASGIWFGNDGKYAIKSEGSWRIQTPG